MMKRKAKEKITMKKDANTVNEKKKKINGRRRQKQMTMMK